MNQHHPGCLAVVIDHDIEKAHTEVALLLNNRPRRLMFTDDGSSRSIGDLVWLKRCRRSKKFYVARTEQRASDRFMRYFDCRYSAASYVFKIWIEDQEIRRVLWADLTLGILERVLEQTGMGPPDPGYCYIDWKTSHLATALEAGRIEVTVTLQAETAT